MNTVAENVDVSRGLLVRHRSSYVCDYPVPLNLTDDHFEHHHLLFLGHYDGVCRYVNSNSGILIKAIQASSGLNNP
jgi:hypothetical protein